MRRTESSLCFAFLGFPLVYRWLFKLADNFLTKYFNNYKLKKMSADFAVILLYADDYCRPKKWDPRTENATSVSVHFDAFSQGAFSDKRHKVRPGAS